MDFADFRDLLAILFRNHPGHSKVIKEEYELEDSRGVVALGNSNRNTIAVPGAIIMMSMIFKRSTSIAKHSCPRCRGVKQ
ncbi:hypothetical protein BJX62DRAFT_114418 [Aspergillus germanicus]